jgi:hypothetical protein
MLLEQAQKTLRELARAKDWKNRVAATGRTGVYLSASYWEHMDYRIGFIHSRLAQHPQLGAPSSNGAIREGANR